LSRYETKNKLTGARPWTLVYVSRKDAVRMIHNEDELIQASTRSTN